MTGATLVGTRDRQFGSVEWACFVATGVIWGSSFLLIDIGLDDLRPGAVTLIRVGLGALTLTILPCGQPAQFTRADTIRLAWLSAIWVALPFTLFPLAEKHINSATAGLLNGATPVFTATIAAVVYRQRSTRRIRTALITGFVGIALISLPTINQGRSQAAGVVMAVAAALCYGVATNAAGPLLQRHGSVAVMRRLLQYATVWTIPFGSIQLSGSHFAARSVLATIFLGIVGTGAAYLLMAHLVGRVGATRGSFVTYIIPVVSLLLGITVNRDDVPGIAFAGIGLVLIGAVRAAHARPVADHASNRSQRSDAANTPPTANHRPNTFTPTTTDRSFVS